MPGIVGIISQRPRKECEAIVETMARSMEHESFYRSRCFGAPELGIYFGAVTFDESLGGGRHLVAESGEVALIFSGECFWSTARYDTPQGLADYLIRLYHQEGDRCFDKLNGTFSGLLLDRKQRRALLFNDRYGAERIYFCQTRDTTLFASEAKALLRVLPETRAFDWEGVAEFLAFGCTLETKTLFKGISLLPGGSVWSIKEGRIQKKRYFVPATWESQDILEPAAFESRFQDTFNTVLTRYFAGNARLGISLTGGLDTRMIMACRPETAEPPVCYTFAGPDGDTIDIRLATRVAATCGLQHEILRLGPDFFSDFASYADRTVFATDGSFGVLGAHEIYLNALARDLAGVRLTGNFGGEIFRSVSTFKPLCLTPELLGGEVRPRVDAVIRNRSTAQQHPVTFAAFKEIPWNLFGCLAAGRSQITFRTPYLDNELVALAYQAPSQLRTTALPALRFIKQNSLVLSKIPTDRGFSGDRIGPLGGLRHCLSEAAFKFEYHTNEGLPSWLSPVEPLLKRVTAATSILGRHKYLHYRSWLRKELAGYLQEALTRLRRWGSPFWNPVVVGELAEAHISGRKNYLRELNVVLTLETIERLFFRLSRSREASYDLAIPSQVLAV